MSAQYIRAALHPFLRRDASPSFHKRAREAAFARVTKDNYNIVTRLPQYIGAPRCLGHKAKLVTKGRQEMLGITLRIAPEQNQKTSSTAFDEAAFRESLSSDMPSDASFFYTVLSVAVSAVAIVSKVVPVFTSDAAHCSNITKGIPFSLYGSIVPHRQVLMAMMLVADNESESTWLLFLQFVKEHLAFDREQFRIITDQYKGGRRPSAGSQVSSAGV